MIAVIPFDVDPHAATFGVACNQLVASQVGDLQRISVHVETCCQFKLFLCPCFTSVKCRNLQGVQPTTNAECPCVVLVDNRIGHPIIAAGHVVQWEVCSEGEIILVGAIPRDGLHVAGLAAVIAECSIRIITAIDRHSLNGAGL